MGYFIIGLAALSTACPHDRAAAGDTRLLRLGAAVTIGIGPSSRVEPGGAVEDDG
jgi:hypothetical protein